MLLTYHKDIISFPNFSENTQIDMDQLPGTLETVQNSILADIFEVCPLQKVVTVQLEAFYPFLVLRLFSRKTKIL